MRVTPCLLAASLSDLAFVTLGGGTFRRLQASKSSLYVSPHLLDPTYPFNPYNLQSKSSAPSKTAQNAAASYEDMKDKRAWDLAISPAKSLPMQAFMLYMSGGGVQVFSMGIVFMLLLSPFKNLAGINTGAPSHLHDVLRTLTVLTPSFELSSVRTLCTRPSREEASHELRGAHDAAPPEDHLPHMQPTHARARSVEVPLDGPAAYGYGRLAGV